MTIKGIITAAGTLLLLYATAACDIEKVGGGRVDGFWHLERVDTLATSGTLDMSGKSVFWAFQAKLMHTQGAEEKCWFRFSLTENTLTTSSPYLDHWHEDVENGGDIPVEDVAFIRPYGIQEKEETFAIEELSGSVMRLRSETLRLFFRKF